MVAFVAEELTLARFPIDVADNRRARRVRTQVSLLRRLSVAAIITLVIATMLLTLPGARQAGATILASAGVLGIVAGLAAQSSLSNLFAGLQLAFTDAIRVDDVVVVENEWGRIEEITLTYVVVHVWDDRRLILPSTYFTTTPFQNWTRKESAVLGAIDLDVDWRVPLDELRIELDRALRASEIWDERVGILQVTDAVGSFVRLRVLVSGVDGPTVLDLRCEIREALVSFLQRTHPEALPRVRVEQAPRFIPTRTRAPGSGADTDPLDLDQPFFVSESESTQTQGLFTGSREAIERARGFTSSGNTGPIADSAGRQDFRLIQGKNWMVRPRVDGQPKSPSPRARSPAVRSPAQRTGTERTCRAPSPPPWMRPGSRVRRAGIPNWPHSSRRSTGRGPSGCCSSTARAGSGRPPCCSSSAFARRSQPPGRRARRTRHRLQPRQFRAGIRARPTAGRRRTSPDRRTGTAGAAARWLRPAGPARRLDAVGIPAVTARGLGGRHRRPGAAHSALANRPGMARAGQPCTDSDPLSASESLDLLGRFAVPADQRTRLAELGRGHPLTLALLADSAVTAAVPDDLVDAPDLVAALVTQIVGEAPDEAHAMGYALCAMAWLTTEDLLRRAVGERAGEVWSWLASRPFITLTPDGLYPHDLVRDVLDADLRRRSPERYRPATTSSITRPSTDCAAATPPGRICGRIRRCILHRHSPLSASFWVPPRTRRGRRCPRPGRRPSRDHRPGQAFRWRAERGDRRRDGLRRNRRACPSSAPPPASPASSCR